MQWVLAYDGACGRCRVIATRVVELGRGQLVARSLREPEVATWRERLLGADAPWEPVLFAVEGAEAVRALTGRRLVLGLVRLLGVRRGLALAAELRELAPVGAGPVLTRRRVLGRLAGVGTALGLLVSGKLALPGGVHAQGVGAERPWWAVEPVKTELLDPVETEKLRAELLAGSDLAAVRGAAELTEVRAARHVLVDGRTLWLIVATVNEQVGILALRDDRGRSAAFLIDVGENVRLTRFSENGQLVRVNHAEQVLRGCGPLEVPCGCCCRFDWRAFVSCCHPCLYACIPPSWRCLACVLISCGAFCLWASCPGGWGCTCCCLVPPG